MLHQINANRAQAPNAIPVLYINRPNISIESINEKEINTANGIRKCYEICHKICVGGYCYKECITVCED